MNVNLMTAVLPKPLLVALIFFSTIVLGVPSTVAVALSLSVLLLDFYRLLSTRNILIGYMTGMFVIAAESLSIFEDIWIDYLLYIAVFTAVIWSVSAYCPKRTSATAQYNSEIASKWFEFSDLRKDRYDKFLRILLFFQFLFLAITVYRTGLRNYVTGAVLASAISSYGRQDITAGLLVIIASAINFITLGVLFAYYAKFPARANLTYLFLFLVLLPLLQLSRYNFLFGIVTFLYVWVRNKEVGPKQELLRARRRVAVAMFAAILCAVVVGVSFGVLREKAVRRSIGTQKVESIPSFSSQLISRYVLSEFTSVIAYAEIRANMDVLQPQLGYTIFVPLFLKVIPRNLWPDKPLNSSGYYMTHMRPDEASSGYFLAPSIWGDVFLNFGYSGSLIIMVMLAIISEKIDKNLMGGRFSNQRLLAFVLFYFLYGLLRNNLSDSVFVAAMVYLTARYVKKYL